MVFDRERERVIHQRTVEQVEAPLVKVVLRERNSDRIVEQFIEFFVSHVGKEIVDVVQFSPNGRRQPVQRRIAEHIVAVPVPLILKENVEMASLVPHVGILDGICNWL